MSLPNRKRREELWNIFAGEASGDVDFNELCTIIDALDRRTELLREYMTGKHGGNAAFMKRIAAELERDNE